MTVRVDIIRRGVGVVAQAVVDDIDADLAERRWRLDKDGYARTTPRRLEDKSLVVVYLHRWIIHRTVGRPLLRSDLTDHINRDKMDNRRSNLRLASKSLSAANKKFDRVVWNKNSKKWLVYIRRDGVTHYGGGYVEREDAVAASKSLLKKIWPEIVP